MATPLSRPSTPPVPSSEPGAFSGGACGNCGAQLAGPFCSQCGEKKFSRHDYSLGHFVEEALDGLTHFDSRFLRTLKLLLTKPGELSNAFFHGGRSRYTKPLSLFIIVNVVFFFVQPHTGIFGYKYAQYVRDPAHHAAVQEHLRKTGEAEQTYIARFDVNLQNQKKSALIFAVPLLALLMLVVFSGTGRTYAEHLVFSVQVYAFLLAFLALYWLVIVTPYLLRLPTRWPATAPVFFAIQTELAIDLLVSAVLALYMYLGFRRAYQTSRARSAISAIILAAAIDSSLVLYQVVLFHTALWIT
ncbi:MAG TPA: DUF3667 domain-containing protein [Gemmatimonadaceae bacterium]|nr:DUF3667 domain-containing protein [Gemmatimonadaceae bacterium]